MEKDLRSWWNEVKEDVAAYLKARGNLTKIQAYEKVGKVTGVMVSFLILALLASFVLICLLVLVGSWIGELTHSNVIGFSVVAGLAAAIFILLLVKRKRWLETPVTIKVIEALYEDHVIPPETDTDTNTVTTNLHAEEEEKI